MEVLIVLLAFGTIIAAMALIGRVVPGGGSRTEILGIELGGGDGDGGGDGSGDGSGGDEGGSSD